jgi:hypothetical protein
MAFFIQFEVFMEMVYNEFLFDNQLVNVELMSNNAQTVSIFIITAVVYINLYDGDSNSPLTWLTS